MSLLRVDRIGKSFSGLQALHEVSFQVGEGEVVGLMGANGAGKTTLFSLIAGNQRPTSGTISFADQIISGLRPHRICRLGVARTFQIVRPFAGLSVRENVEIAVLYGADTQDRGSPVSDRAQTVLERVGLGRVAEQLAGTLTLSNRKRLEVARALGTAPRLLLLDEVMAGLTPTEVREMLVTLESVKQEFNLTLVVVEHVIKALTTLSERLVVLHHGELIAEGTPEDIAQHQAVQEAYFGRSY